MKIKEPVYAGTEVFHNCCLPYWVFTTGIRTACFEKGIIGAESRFKLHKKGCFPALQGAVLSTYSANFWMLGESLAP